MTDDTKTDDEGEQAFTLHVIFKSGERQDVQDFITDDGKSTTLECFAHVQEHLKKFGFSGWRLLGGLIFLNMREVAAIYATPQNDSEDDDAGEEASA